MGTKYSTILVGGVVQTYNDNPPSDDGSQTEANRVKYVTVTSDLTAPLHSAITSMDAKLVAYANEGPDTESGTVTLTTADHNKVLECTGTFVLSLPNPSGNAGFQCTIKNAGSGVITVDVAGGANIDGVSSISLAAGEASKVYVNNAGTAYYSVTGNETANEFPSGTIMLFEQTNAPTGWTKKTAAAYHNAAIRISTGTVTDVTGGSVDFTTVFGLTATDGHTLSGAESGTSAHSHPAHRHQILKTFTGGGGGNRTYITIGTTSGLGDTPDYDDVDPLTSTPYIQNTTISNSSQAAASSAHAHNIDLQVKYRDVIFAEKD